ncbi:uncharacterized protein METZ01_LOCUS462886 [marine metagenome]|uniref:Uncharacterized protein n=1 Tax=marine metagenome TaxID=408172 RepID=A0A383AQK9_9ZZZZ
MEQTVVDKDSQLKVNDLEMRVSDLRGYL